MPKPRGRPRGRQTKPPVSLHPLEPEDALAGLMQVKPEGTEDNMAKIEQVIGTLVAADTDAKKLTLTDVGGRRADRKEYSYELGLNEAEFMDLMGYAVVCIMSDEVIKKLDAIPEPGVGGI